MEPQQKMSNENEKSNTVYIKNKTNSQILPPMGMVFVFCTLMLIGRTVKQNFCPGYSALLSAQQESATNVNLEQKQVVVNPQHKLQQIVNERAEFENQAEVCFKNTEINGVNRAVCNKKDFKYKENEQIEIPSPEKPQKLTLEQIEKLNGGNLLNKQRTSEPIIYLFVFIFIYLLLKSIADINSHYKKKMSGDNNSRRYSLQSYAQIHRYEQRRASRGIGAKLSYFN